MLRPWSANFRWKAYRPVCFGVHWLPSTVQRRRLGFEAKCFPSFLTTHASVGNTFNARISDAGVAIAKFAALKKRRRKEVVIFRPRAISVHTLCRVVLVPIFSSLLGFNYGVRFISFSVTHAKRA